MMVGTAVMMADLHLFLRYGVNAGCVKNEDLSADLAFRDPPL